MRRDLIRRFLEEASAEGKTGGYVDIDLAMKAFGAQHGLAADRALVPEAADAESIDASVESLLEDLQR